MSDTEEVIIRRAVKEPKNTKPEIAREKLKEKRERLKKEKENFIIEEAKKRLASETEKKAQEEALAKQQEEEKRMADPTYMMMKRMEEMMLKLQKREEMMMTPTGRLQLKAMDAIKLEDEVLQPPKAKRSSKKKAEPEPEPEPEEKPKRKPRVPKDQVVKPNKSPGLPKPRKKVVYLKQEPKESDSTQFVGYDVAPPAEPIQYQPSSGLLSALMGRRNMNSIYQ
jgi:hypothetical protein